MITINILKRWVPLAFLTCCFCGLAYITVQQNYRQSANDPQIQMAEDAAAAFGTGAPTQAVVPAGTVDIATSLAPYIVIYNASGNPIAGNGFLDGALPQMPAGVFDWTQSEGGEHWFTWQPQPGVRSAVVIDAINGAQGGFVMAGRSLREVEIREDNLTLEVGAIFIFSLIGSLVLVIAGELWRAKK